MIRDRKALLGVIATQSNVQVEILLSQLRKFVPDSEVLHKPSGASKMVQPRSTPLLMRSEGGQRAILYDARPVYLLKKSKIKHQPGKVRRTGKHAPVIGLDIISLTLGQKRDWRTINFAISAFIVSRNSPAVWCEIL